MNSSAATPQLVSVRFLGGLGEIGRNCLVITQGRDAVVIDCGVMFPKADMPGVDVVLPDYRYLIEADLDLHGVLVTHGHEDHIGALPHLLRERVMPIYGSPVTLAFARSRLEQSGVSGISYHEIDDYGSVRVGPFDVEFIPVTHSIPGATAIVVSTEQGLILHTGDFKIDRTPVDHRAFGLDRMATLGAVGVRLLLSDSTNADEPGSSNSESSVGLVLSEVFAENQDRRLTVVCFASHLHRIQQIMAACRASGRKICLVGRSLQRNVKLADQLGLFPAGALEGFVDVEVIDDLDPASVCVIATGSQGEHSSALHRLAFAKDPWFEMGDRDTVIFSSDTIPGNESAVYRVINQLARLGVRAIYPSVRRVHSSGHARRDELELLITLVRPEFFIPVHGEYRHLAAHHQLALTTGAVAGEARICDDGDEVLLSEQGLAWGESRSGDYLYVDGKVGDINASVLRDRRSLSADGIVVAALTMAEGRQLVGDPEIFSFGWVHDEREEGLLLAIRDVVSATVVGLRPDQGVSHLKDQLKRRVGKYVREQTKRRPLVVPLVIEV
ncbi:ribonuclease J [Ferrimicrobium acidiphilum]|uniref:ribonuclease J n=1 Tax=Ferrimicrobium acidiphilum TaxID=121039 RepID=UPI0023F34C2E|nr:ribonuclease J [Ferrimicrobium acidiphilum]